MTEQSRYKSKASTYAGSVPIIVGVFPFLLVMLARSNRLYTARCHRHNAK